MNANGKLVVLIAISVAGLTGCAGSTEPVPTSAPRAATSSVLAPSTSGAAWSPQAVDACRKFVNGLSGTSMSMATSDQQQYRPGMTKEQLSLALVGWSLATANITISASIGDDAEPEVHDALAAVVAAKELHPIRVVNGEIVDNNEAFVKGWSAAFTGALAICKEVGVAR